MNAQNEDFFSQCDERFIFRMSGKTKKHLRRSAFYLVKLILLMLSDRLDVLLFRI